MRNPVYNSNSTIISEVAASNMTSLPQEFDDSEKPSLLTRLNYLLENGAAQHIKVKWGKGERYVIMININIKTNATLIKIFKKDSQYIHL